MNITQIKSCRNKRVHFPKSYLNEIFLHIIKFVLRTHFQLKWKIKNRQLKNQLPEI